VAQSEGDRLILAWVQGVISRHVLYRELTVEERTQAVAEIRAVTTRPELLAEVAGIRRGMAPHQVVPLEAERYERMARLLIEAGADVTAVESWVEIGCLRAEEAKAIPYTGSRHSP
jgi:hypothetical protein